MSDCDLSRIAGFACPEDYSKISSVLSLIARDML